jgi:hypothetical protein
VTLTGRGAVVSVEERPEGTNAFKRSVADSGAWMSSLVEAARAAPHFGLFGCFASDRMQLAELVAKTNMRAEHELLPFYGTCYFAVGHFRGTPILPKKRASSASRLRSYCGKDLGAYSYLFSCCICAVCALKPCRQNIECSVISPHTPRRRGARHLGCIDAFLAAACS